MQIRNVKGLALQIAETGEVVEADGIATVDDALGAALLEQPTNWTAVQKPNTKQKENDR